MKKNKYHKPRSYKNQIYKSTEWGFYLKTFGFFKPTILFVSIWSIGKFQLESFLWVVGVMILLYSFVEAGDKMADFFLCLFTNPTHLTWKRVVNFILSILLVFIAVFISQFLGINLSE